MTVHTGSPLPYHLPLDFGASQQPYACPKHGLQPSTFLLRVATVERRYCPLCLITILDHAMLALHRDPPYYDPLA